VALEVLLESASGGVYTTARAMFRTSLDCGLYVKTDHHPPLFGIFHRGGDIVLGDPHWDRSFVVEAVHADRARSVLSPPAVRSRMLEAAEGSTDFIVNDVEVLVVHGGLQSPRGLARSLDALVALVDALTPAASSQGPFR
jgi:hypothetical protein